MILPPHTTATSDLIAYLGLALVLAKARASISTLGTAFLLAAVVGSGNYDAERSGGWYAPPGIDLSAFGERRWL